MTFHENSNVSIYLSDLILLETPRSSVQEVSLYSHPELGFVLIINGEVQHISEWSCYYHESLVHLPIAFIPEIEKVLILGGGDLYAANEVLKYPTIKEVVICEWDPSVIDITRKYYNHGDAVCSDSKVRIECCDAKDYIKLCQESFDLVINDCFNLVDDFDSDFIFADLNRLLTSEGVCTDIIYRHIFESTCLNKTLYALNSFCKSAYSLVTVPEYPGVLHLLAMWGNNKRISQSAKRTVNGCQNEWLVSKSSPLQLFNPLYLDYYLYLPQYLKRLIEKGSQKDPFK